MYRHVHHFKIESSLSLAHYHRLIGYTEYVIGTGRFHFHFYSGISTYTNHTHYFSGVTGLPLRTENGHIHKMEGMLETNNSHKHRFSGCTFEEVSYTKGNKAKEVLI
jgi:hypothetical protein